ncbi:MAG TPA: 30S ribosomal protein S18 [Candidatus Paceibacterota bacterium]
MPTMQCPFCANNVEHIDYKDIETLKKYLDTFARIGRKRNTNVCSLHQRKLARAVKQARFMALLPFVAY